MAGFMDGNLAPQRKRPNEKPPGQTVDYDELLKTWKAEPRRLRTRSPVALTPMQLSRRSMPARSPFFRFSLTPTPG